ncbi:MAG: 2-amino-4-hydroxy-6-hydroxymethyldihydropteridine diphosphokinase [Pacificimonas sp.]
MSIVVALGSNRPHGRHGQPRSILHAALNAIAAIGIEIVEVSQVIETAPLGPSSRRYANAVATIDTRRSPEELLTSLHMIENEFGRRRQRRWGARVLDLDLIAYEQEVRGGPRLVLPHPAMHLRRFVLGPMLHVAPDWRHPILNLSTRQMYARLVARR